MRKKQHTSTNLVFVEVHNGVLFKMEVSNKINFLLQKFFNYLIYSKLKFKKTFKPKKCKVTTSFSTILFSSLTFLEFAL
ncbi:MAG: hypothetical protein A3F12_03625 [Gammaproteobacteria bacterium RIFCSPHIGHO2_12_FULL_38_14]|nr:MAG: hypothetical protein A3F12_03625 [Gammaproteobacteria bacterium RIFCSPHIGHO2_12_FULL_38_14]